MSLDFDNLETPVQAFYRKWDRRRKLPVQQLADGGREI
jgi:hypothetical protein